MARRAGLENGPALLTINGHAEALTTVPATWLGIEKTHGTIAVGKSANFVVADGDLFTEEAAVRDEWVQGTRFGVSRPRQIDPRGTWAITSDDPGTFKTATLRLDGPLNRTRGTIEMSGRRPVTLTSARIIAETGRLEATFPGETLGQEGGMLLAGSVEDSSFFGWLSLPNGTDARCRGTRTERIRHCVAKRSSRRRMSLSAISAGTCSAVSCCRFASLL